MSAPKKATIRDVAKSARVSPATVSRFLNGTLALPPETEMRVREAIATLNYRPNALARSLSLGHSRTIGLVVPEIANPFFAQLASAAEAEAFQHGYGLLLCSSGGSPEREVAYLEMLESRQLDGIIFVTDYDRKIPQLASLARYAPVVLVDEDVDGVETSKVFVDNRRGGGLATEYLLEHGHTRIGFVGAQRHLMTGRERFEGYVDALHAAAVALDEKLLHFGSYSEETGVEGLERLLAVPSAATAIFAGNDTIAVGIIREARRRHLSIPEDLSLVGFDGVPIGAVLSPALTTVVQPIDELGRLGVRKLLARLDRPGPAEPPIRLPVRLEVRGSVARRPALNQP